MIISYRITRLPSAKRVCLKSSWQPVGTQRSNSHLDVGSPAMGNLNRVRMKSRFLPVACWDFVIPLLKDETSG